MKPGIVWKAIGLGGLIAASLALGACQLGPQEAVESTRRLQRQSTRAYDGAPPLIPHEVENLSSDDCLGCHEEGLDLGEDGLAPATPHPQFTNCQQCHLAQQEASSWVANTFQGWRNPPRGTRSLATAPPTIPHSIQMRENCLSCHGDLGGAPLRTSHGERTNCRQCHVESELQ